MSRKQTQTLPGLTDESRARDKLGQDINSCQERFSALSAKVEELKLELSAVSQAYTARIGPLYLRQDAAAAELKKEREIGRLMRSGLSRAAATRKAGVERKPDPGMEEPQPDGADENIDPRPKEFAELKAVWRGLVSRFHPDLARDPDDKARRTALVQKINDAYKHADIDRLKRIQFENSDPADSCTTIKSLKQRLRFLKRALGRLEREQARLERSVWYSWLGRINAAAADGRDLLSELSKQLRMTVRDKESKLRKLREKHDRQGA